MMPNKSWKCPGGFNVFVFSSPSGETVEGGPTRADAADEKAAAKPGKGNYVRPIRRTINVGVDEERMS
jgi:hypothetical protein